MSTRIAVCDDEKIYSDKVCQCIHEGMKNNQYTEYELLVYNQTDDIKAQLENIVNCDVVFLDMKMPNLNGYQLACDLKEKNHKIHIVIVTSFIDFAMYGYKINIDRFVLKTMMKEHMEETMKYIVATLQREKCVVEFNFKEGNIKICLSDVVYIESEKHRVYFNMINDEVLTMYSKLDLVELQIERANFIRIHKSFLVNYQYIDKVVNYEVVLKDGRKLSIPKTRIKQVRDDLKKIREALL